MGWHVSSVPYGFIIAFGEIAGNPRFFKEMINYRNGAETAGFKN